MLLATETATAGRNVNDKTMLSVQIFYTQKLAQFSSNFEAQILRNQYLEYSPSIGITAIIGLNTESYKDWTAFTSLAVNAASTTCYSSLIIVRGVW